MAVFVSIAAVLVVAALIVVLRPLVRRSPVAAGIEHRQANVQILRDQLAELDSDVKNGVLPAEQYQRARADLERRVLEESEISAPPRAHTGRTGVAIATVIGISMPVAAAALYLYLGKPAGLNVKPHAAADVSSITAEHFETMTGKLAARLERNPDDAEGWSMLGRAYTALERRAEAAQAWARAATLKPNDPAVLTDYAQALAIFHDGSLAGEPTRLLERALKLDPQRDKALALAGGAAFERQDYKAAIGYWERLLGQAGEDAELTQALTSGIREARARMTGKPVTPAAITGKVSIAPALMALVAPEDSVFVFVRAEQGPRMPLAIKRVQVKNLPYDFRLDDSMAMVPEMKLSSFSRVIVGARVSKSGSAQPASGDLEGFSAVVNPGASGINVVIDRAVQ